MTLWTAALSFFAGVLASLCFFLEEETILYLGTTALHVGAVFCAIVATSAALWLTAGFVGEKVLSPPSRRSRAKKLGLVIAGCVSAAIVLRSDEFFAKGALLVADDYGDECLARRLVALVYGANKKHKYGLAFVHYSETNHCKNYKMDVTLLDDDSLIKASYMRHLEVFGRAKAMKCPIEGTSSSDSGAVCTTFSLRVSLRAKWEPYILSFLHEAEEEYRLELDGKLLPPMNIDKTKWRWID